jgi:tetratricopeptide (TPR) repeat protein
MRAHQGEADAAAAAFEESLRQRRTAWAIRALAVLDAARGRRGRAADRYREALALRPDLVPLAVECAASHIAAGQAEEWLAIGPTLPPEVRDHGRVRLLTGRAWLETGRLAELERFLADPPEVADMREGEVSLSDLWFSLREARKREQLGRPLDDRERRALRRSDPPPPAIDFRMDGDEPT